MTNRRETITLLGGAAAAWPLAARAQQGNRMRRIGVLIPGDGGGFVPLAQALVDLGWTDGRNVRIDVRRSGADTNRIRAIDARCAVVNASGMTTKPPPGSRPRAMMAVSISPSL